MRVKKQDPRPRPTKVWQPTIVVGARHREGGWESPQRFRLESAYTEPYMPGLYPGGYREFADFCKLDITKLAVFFFSK